MILITTATGQIGSAAASALVRQGRAVRGGSRDPSRVKGAPAVRFDFADQATFAPALDGVTAALVLTPPGHVDALGVVGGFVREAAARGVRLVTVTASGVETSDEIPLRKVELLVERSGSGFTHLRPTWFTQNFGTYWRAPIASDGVIPLPAADAQTAFIDARDIGEAAAVILGDAAHDGKAITLTGPEALTYGEAAAILGSAVGRTIRYVPIDDEAFVRGAVTAGLGEDYARLLAALFGAVRAGAAAHVDPALATLLQKPPRTVESYVAEHAHLWAS